MTNNIQFNKWFSRYHLGIKICSYIYLSDHVYELPVTWGSAVVFAGYSGFLHYLHLASHEVAIIGINVTKNKIPNPKPCVCSKCEWLMIAFGFPRIQT